MVLLLVMLGVVATAALDGLRSYDPSYCTSYASAIANIDGEISTGGDEQAIDDLTAQRNEVIQQAQLAKKSKACPDPLAGVANVPTDLPTALPPPPPPSSEPGSPRPNSDAWTPHFYFFDSGKSSAAAFGPPVDPKTAVQDFPVRMHKDPSLLCGNGGLILNKADGGISCVRKLMASAKARDAYEKKVFAEIAKVELIKKGPGKVHSAYMAAGPNDIPTITRQDVLRPAEYLVLRVTLKDGTVFDFRLRCGYQWDAAVVTVHIAPAVKCINGGTRDTEGICQLPSRPASTSKSTSTRTPTGTSSTPPPTTSTPPPTTSKPSCPPGTYWSGTWKECLVNKPSGTPTGTTQPSPTGSRENTPSAQPTPATTNTPTITAPGGSTVPTPSGTAPAITNTPPPSSPGPTIPTPAG